MFPRKSKLAPTSVVGAAGGSTETAASVHRFADLKRDTSSRVKHLKIALESCALSQERRILLEEYSFESFHLVEELMIQADYLAASANPRSAVDIECALWVLEQLLCYLPDMIAHRWQYFAICHMMKKCLLPQNLIPLRKITMRLYIIWYQTLGSTEDEYGVPSELDDMFAYLLPHFPLRTGEDTERLLAAACDSHYNPDGTLKAETSTPTKGAGSGDYPPFPAKVRPVTVMTAAEQRAATAVDRPRLSMLQGYIDKFFEYLGRETLKLEWRADRKHHQRRCIAFLVKRVKRRYVPHCFPELALVDLYDEETNEGQLEAIAARPAYIVDEPITVARYYVIRFVAVYSYSYKILSESLPNNEQRGSSSLPAVETLRVPASYETVRSVLFGSRENVRMSVALIREGLLLPMQCSGVIAKSFRILKEWILQEELPDFVYIRRDDDTTDRNAPDQRHMVELQRAIQTFLYALIAFYFNPNLLSDRERVQNAFQVNQRILGLLKDLANPQRSGPHMEYSAETWSVYLECILKVVSKTVPPEPTVRNLSPFALGITTSLFQTLLITWVFVGGVRAVPLSDGLWDELLRVLRRRRCWSELIDEWTKVLESVTRALAVNCYGIDLHDLPLDRLSEQKVKKGRGQRREYDASLSVKSGDAGAGDTAAQSSSAVARPNTLTGGAGGASGGAVGNGKVTQYDFCQPPVISTPVADRVLPPHFAAHSAGPPTKPTKSIEKNQLLLGGGSDEQPPLSAPAYMAPLTDAGAEGGVAPSRYSFTPAAEKRESETTSGHSTASSNQHDVVSNHSLGGEDSGDSTSLRLFDNVSTGGVGEGGARTSVMDFGAIASHSVVFPHDEDRDSPSPQQGTSDFDDSVDDQFDLTQQEAGDVEITPREGDSNINDEAAYAKSWTVVWKRIIGCLGDINEIASPATHLKATQTLVRTIESLLKVSRNQGVVVAATTSQSTLTPLTGAFPSAVPPLLWLAPWLLNTTDMTDAFADSRRAALVALARVIFRRRHELPLERRLLARFFAAVRRALASPLAAVSACALDATVPVQLYAYVPGACRLLLPETLTAAERLMKNAERPEAVTRKAVLLAACLASPDAFGEAVNRRAIDLLMEVMSSVGASTDVRRLAANGLSVHLLHQLTSGGRLEVSGESLQILAELLNCAATEKEDVALLICENLGALLPVASASTKRQLATILGERVIRVYCDCLNLLSVNSTRHSDELAVRMLTDVGEWCVLLGGAGGMDQNALSLTVSALLRFAHCHYRLAVTAASVLTSLLHRFAQYPLPQFGAAQTGCLDGNEFAKTTTPLRSDTVVCGRPSEKAIWTIKSATDTNAGFSLALRRLSGKHCWRVDSIEAAKSDVNTNVNKWLDDVADKQTQEGIDRISIPYCGTRTEPLLELLEHIVSTSPECLPRSNFPNTLTAANGTGFEAGVASALEDISLVGSEYVGEPVPETKPSPPSWSVLWRRFLSDFSKPLWEAKGELSVLSREASRLERELSHLDRLFCRECHKVAVIYVAAGQEDKLSILNNQRGSVAFEDFVGRLGWEVELRGHRGYCGGLPPENSTAYYATSALEVVWHVSTRLAAADQELTKRLKHLGNDEVHVIWSEHDRDYRRSIIATEFCDVLIVVYPLPAESSASGGCGGMLRVTVESRIDAPFGPLFDGAVVAAVSLDVLVRTTAVNAGRAKRRANGSSWKRWDEHRSDVIANTLTSMRKTAPYSNVTAAVYNQTADESTC